MCHVSVGHTARVFEEAGLPTVVIGTSVFKTRLAKMNIPRLLLTSELLGKTLGKPFEMETQKKYLLAALDLLEKAETGNSLIEM